MTEYYTTKTLLASEHPEREVWDLLSLNTTGQKLNSPSSAEYSPQQLRTIRTLLEQSRELYNASANMSLQCAPLIDFYSYSMLAKILSIKSLRRGLETFPKGHGLSFSIEAGKVIDADNVTLEITNRGTFIELLRSHEKSRTIEEYFGSRVSLTELLKHDIDIHDYMPTDAKNLPIHSIEVFPLDKVPNSKHEFQLVIRLAGVQRPEAFELAKKEVPDLDFSAFSTRNAIRIDLPGYPIFMEYNSGDPMPDFAAEMNFAGQTFLVPPIRAKDRILLFNQVEIVYLILFAASNLVRYYPDQWVDMLSDENRMWNLRKALGLARRSYPNHILNHVAEEFHVILPPGTLRYP